MPVNLHINTGHGYHKYPEKMNGSHQTAMKLHQALNTLHDLIYSGVLERFPELKFVLAENEIGWVPWVLEQWDFTLVKGRSGSRIGPSSDRFYKPEEAMRLLPSEYYHRQVYSTFFNDSVGGRGARSGGAPTTACGRATSPTATRRGRTRRSSWPETSPTCRRAPGPRWCCENVAKLYDFAIPTHVADCRRQPH